MSRFDDIDAIMNAVRCGYLTHEQARELPECPLTNGKKIRELGAYYRQREIQRGLPMHQERESARSAYEAQRTSTDPYTNNRLADECQRLKDENDSLRAELARLKKTR